MYSDWHALGEVQYRKWPVYETMRWDTGLRLDENIVSGASYGGPIAMVRDHRRIIPQDEADTAADIFLNIYSSAGDKLAAIPWEDKKRVIGLGWSEQEQLIVVLDDGSGMLYNINGLLITKFSVFGDGTPPNIKVIEVHCWANGCVAMGSNLQLYTVEGFNNPSRLKKTQFKTSLNPEFRPYTSMALVPPLLSRFGMLEVMLGTLDNSVIVVDENDVEDQLLQDRIAAAIDKMALAPNGRFLACYRRDGILTVMSSNFTTKVLDFDTKSMTRPLEMAWCGEDAVVLHWKNTGILVVGPYGDWLNFLYQDAVHLVAEPDCCRVVGTTSCEIFQRVPAATEAIRRIGSTEPAALLYDAMEGFEDGDPKSDDNIRSMSASDQLVEAVQSCINAAVAEFDIKRQQDFLRAASYGKTFCNNLDPEEFVESAKKLRVLNDIRRPEIGIPLTVQQFNRLTPESLVGRLTQRSFHFLALKICELLKLRCEDRVLVHWACGKVKKMAQSNMPDDAIARAIQSKLEKCNRVSYLEIASTAHQIGKVKLATMLLDLEQNPADQVPLLLSMHEEELALQKAIGSGDTDLLHIAILHLEKSKRGDPALFYKLVLQYPEATNLLRVYYRNKITPTDRSLYHNFMINSKNYLEAGIATMNQCGVETDFARKAQLTKEAIALFAQGKNDLSFVKNMAEENAELMEMQKALEVRTGRRDFVGMSVSETLSALTILCVENKVELSKWNAEIAKVVKKFKVSDKTLWSIKIYIFSERAEWDMLKTLALEKKSPVGYKPFAEACVKYKRPEGEVAFYIDKISSPEERYDLYAEYKYWARAAEVAVKLKDERRMYEVGKQCHDPQLEKYLEEQLSKL